MAMAEDTAAPAEEAAPPKRERIYRHAATTRVTHWVNLLCVTVLLLSGLQIFNAHPRLYWGQYGANADHAFIAMEAMRDNQGRYVGVTTIGPAQLNTTGVLGVSARNGQMEPHGFPAWLTLPSVRDLATGRNLHFFFA